ncbi:uncharacterized protein LOC116300485 isoform X2 [Actinia tenebrosa]|uniref:Uncharacterized protein LOC116300485 isoform X2 n=1 Tax=Actinia tenebrosa TaxID=6105 RepID=A0A6P8IEF8_ACTTE|nr:uncharacterized protein LOC116300485 isoform X2 [Actinia tenebrosa]
MATRTVQVFSQIPNLTRILAKKCSELNFKEIPAPEGFNQDAVTKLQEAGILICDPVIVPYLSQLSNLKWLQLTWAGIDSVIASFKDKAPPPYLITRFGGVFGQAMAEYVIGEIIARERISRKLWKRQEEHNWSNDVKYRNLSKLTLGILGFGDIGKEVAKYCKALGMTIWAMGRTPRTELPPNVDNFRTQSGLKEVLESSDYICNILPSTPTTKNLLSGDVLEVCKCRQSVFINVGRGDVISEEGLLRALKNGWIAGAVLDVFEVEPLPKSSELWDMPGVTITPHCAAISFAEEVAEVFAKNYKLFEQGKPLNYLVDVSRGY